MTYFTDLNNIQGYNDYYKTLGILKNKYHKYDIFGYDTLYLKIFSPYLLELENYLPDEYLKLFSSDNNIKISVYNNHRYGLPLFYIFSILFTNNKYMEKYNIKIPKTWDELIETSKYILNEERIKYNNTEIIGYNGLYPYNENTLCSFYQMLYSYRDTKDEPLPEFTSQNAIDALNKLIEIKNEISSDDIFRSNEVYIISQMNLDKFLFVNFYSSLQIDNYKVSTLPGKNNKINGSVLGGFNMGINKNISNERIEAALTVMKFFFSKEFHKEILLKKLNIYSPILELYNDTEVCSIMDCNMMNEIQFYIRPSSTMKNYGIFSEKVLKYLQTYIDGKISTKEVLKDIDDINRIYYFTIQSTIGSIMFIIILFIVFIVLLSSCILFIPKYEKYFKFMNLKLWILYAFGSLLTALSNFEFFNMKTAKKCVIHYVLLEFGNSLILIPIFY
eukprot:jgi/Orpsp1_1/1185506/evm.model.c7180000094118.1